MLSQFVCIRLSEDTEKARWKTFRYPFDSTIGNVKSDMMFKSLNGIWQRRFILYEFAMFGKYTNGFLLISVFASKDQQSQSELKMN